MVSTCAVQVVATHRAKDPAGRSLILQGHIDVVPEGPADMWTHPPYAAVSRVSRGTVRASSAVECMNSVLRMHQSRHRTVTQGLLDLKRLYWNCRPFREGKRRGRCPYKHLGLKLPSYRFWDLLWISTPTAEAI